MRTLILSCNTGQGHNACGKAIAQYFEQVGEVCKMEDALALISKRQSDFIANWHNRIYRHLPHAFSRGYQFSERHPKLFEEGKLVYRYLTSGTPALKQLIETGGYDTVICTHSFAAIALTKLLSEHPMPIRSAYISTDYTIHPGTNHSNLDLYSVPDASLIPVFLEQGIPESKLVVSGIPVRAAFYGKRPAEEAKAACGIDPTHTHLVMMCGSMGCGPIKEIAELLAEKLRPEEELSVVCGSNQKLHAHLQGKLDGRPNLHVLGYVNNVSELMDSADLFLTKPGGISTSEAAVKGLPMVLIDAVAGCEDYNLAFFCGHGTAVTAPTPEALADLCADLLRNPQERAQMAARYADLAIGNAAKILYERLAKDMAVEREGAREEAREGTRMEKTF